MTDPATEMTVDERLEAVLSRAYRGIHHIPNTIHKHPRYWEVNVYDGISTFDFDVLTRLVLAAHRYAVRVEISCSGPHLIKLMLHPRQREGRIYDRHPTIEEAIRDYMAGDSYNTDPEDAKKLIEESKLCLEEKTDPPAAAPDQDATPS